VADQLVEPGLVPIDAVVLGFTDLSDPFAVTHNEITPEDHARPIVLEPLGRVDASDLTEAPGVGRPQRRRWRAVHLGHILLVLRVPRALPVPDLDVLDQLVSAPTVGHRIAPLPAEARGHPGSAAV